jgi:hypothetical protein
MRELLYLVSPAGNPNFGDEAIVAGWLRFLARSRPDADVVLDCPNPVRAAALLAGIHPNLSVTDSLWRACFERPRGDAAGAWNHVRARVLLRDRARFHPELDPLYRAQSIHLLGGGYLNGVWAHQVGLVAGMTAARQVTGAALYGTGLGLLPACPELPEIGRALSSFDQVSCRDSPSALHFGLRFGVDDVFLGLTTGQAPFTRAADAAKDVMVSVQSDLVDPGWTSAVTARLSTRLRRALDDGLSVGYVEAFPGSDREMFERLDGLIAEEDFVSFDALWRGGLPVRAGQEWYTSRFHLHLTAAAAGAGGVALGVRPGYYDIKHRSLQELGSGWQYAAGAADDLPEPTADPAFALRAEDYAAMKLAEARSVYPARPSTRSRADRTGLVSAGTDGVLVAS